MVLTPGLNDISKVLPSVLLQAPDGNLQYSPALQSDADKQRQRNGSTVFELDALHGVRAKLD